MPRVFSFALLRPLTLLVSLFSAFALSGCVNFETLSEGEGGGTQTQDPRSLSREEILMAQVPPRYTVGDRYEFDNPEVTWQVIAIRGDEVDWISNNGESQTTANNPLLPALVWNSAARGSGKRLITASEGALFPLAVGNRMVFRTTVSTDQPPYAWEFDWSCAVMGEAFLPSWSHTAGTMADMENTQKNTREIHTYEVQCGRERLDELTFYYAPMVGHYVRMIATAEAREGAEDGAIVRNLTNFSRTIQTAEGSRKVTAASIGLASAPDLPKALNDAQMATATIVNPDTPATSVTIDQRGQPNAAAQTAQLPDTIAEAVRVAVTQPDQTSQIQVTSAAASQSIRGPAIHLASYRKPESAEVGWRQISAQFGPALQGLKPIVKRVDLGAKGIYYRLHAGILADPKQAYAVCQRLKQRGAYCKASML